MASAQLLGYARVSTADQAPALQLDELRVAGCEHIWTDHATGTRADRPQLGRLLEHMHEGDTLVVWRLDRLARSLSDLLAIAARLELAGVGLRSLREHIDTTTPGGRLIFQASGRWRSSRVPWCANGPTLGWPPPARARAARWAQAGHDAGQDRHRAADARRP